jgi:hypothetical protein
MLGWLSEATSGLLVSFIAAAGVAISIEELMKKPAKKAVTRKGAVARKAAAKKTATKRVSAKRPAVKKPAAKKVDPAKKLTKDIAAAERAVVSAEKALTRAKDKLAKLAARKQAAVHKAASKKPKLAVVAAAA